MCPQEDFLFIKLITCFKISLLNNCQRDFQFHVKTTKSKRGASKPEDLDSRFEKRRCTDEKTCHYVLSGHHEQTTKDFPEPSNSA
jgi:hypothetical protein